ncbi:MAG: RsiV family protein [Phascolarctobacterium faecium]
MARTNEKTNRCLSKVIISGNEKFYLNSDLDNWGIYVVYNPGEVAPMAAGIQKYYLPIDTISDIISYQLK